MNAGNEATSLDEPHETGRGTDGIAEFRSTPRQLRNLLIAVIITFGVAVAAGFVAISAKSAGAANLAATAGLCWLLFFYCYLAYVFASTKFGPRGIRGRGIAGRYEYRWEQIDNVARRAFTSRGVTTYTVILTTTDGDRIRLGAPVSGGLMGDPAFDAKYAQIRAAWQAATGRTGPEADTKSIWTRGLILITAGICVQLIAVAVIAAILSYYGPAFAAHEGEGTPGVFSPQIPNCAQPGCTWFGQFMANSGKVKYATLAAGGPAIDQQGVNVPAVDSGAKYTVYPVGGGTAWQAPAAGLAAASGVVLVVLAAELTGGLHMRRRRLRRARTGLARLSDPAQVRQA
jgi:hypothetical protein